MLERTPPRRAWRATLAGAAALLTGLLGAAQAQAATHPMDPLSAEEIQQAVRVLSSAGKVGPDTRFPILRMEELRKSKVLAWQPGQAIERQAFAMLFDKGATYEAVVNLTTSQVVSWRHVPGVQPPITMEEYMVAHEAAVSDVRFQAALALRGIYDVSTLICLPLSAGYDGAPDEEGKRLLRVTCLTVADTSNAWSRPIENLTAVVDLNARSVLKVVDSGAVPVPTAMSEYPSPITRPAPKPLVVTQPSGSDVTITGNTIKWDRWNFHVRIEQREGLVLSTASYAGRPVIYRAGLGEIFVPYADATSNWYFRSYMDEGEYGFGKSVQPLVRGHDCPDNAAFLDVTLADDFGNPFVVPGGICVFERAPQMAVRHFDIFTLQTLTRAGRELVVRFATVVGNYDYMTDFVFRQDGQVDFRAGAGGVMGVKAVRSWTVQDDVTGADTAHGPLVDHQIVGTMHQHVFNLRLDIDVDERDNNFQVLEPKMVLNPYGTPRRTAWVLDRHPVRTEAEGRLDHHSHGTWAVLSTSKQNKLGYNTGYTVDTHGFSELLMSADDSAVKRAAFAQFPLWVTKYSQKELYSAGDYPNQAKGGDGLPAYIQDNASLEGKDLVLWVNVGLSHVPRAEDWPVMATEWFGHVEIKPFNFFDSSPLMDLPDVP